MRQLIATPYYHARLGHQTYTIASAILFAYLTDSKVLRPIYEGQCKKWNQYIDWSLCELTSSNEYPNNKVTIDLFYQDKDMDSLEKLYRLMDIILASSTSSIIRLPFDQSLSVSWRSLMSPRFRKIIRPVFTSMPSPIQGDYIAIHVRRGDVSAQKHTQLFIGSDFYRKLLRHLMDLNLTGMPIYIISEGLEPTLVNLIKNYLDQGHSIHHLTSKDSLISIDADVRDFSIMMNAKILITGSSNFSQWAHIASKPNQRVALTHSALSANKVESKDLHENASEEHIAKIISSLF